MGSRCIISLDLFKDSILPFVVTHQVRLWLNVQVSARHCLLGLISCRNALCQPHVLPFDTIAGHSSRFVEVDCGALASLRELSGSLGWSKLCLLCRCYDCILLPYRLLLGDWLHFVLVFKEIGRGNLSLDFVSDDIHLSLQSPRLILIEYWLQAHAFLELVVHCLIYLTYRVGTDLWPSCWVEESGFHVLTGDLLGDFMLRRLWNLVHTYGSLFNRLDFAMGPFHAQSNLELVRHSLLHLVNVMLNNLFKGWLIL